MSDYVFTLNRGAICWKSSKQHTVADYVCKIEYNAASFAIKYSARLSLGARDCESRWHWASKDQQKGELSQLFH